MKREVDISREDRSDGINQTQELHWEKQALWGSSLECVTLEVLCGMWEEKGRQVVDFRT